MKLDRRNWIERIASVKIECVRFENRSLSQYEISSPKRLQNANLCHVRLFAVRIAFAFIFRCKLTSWILTQNNVNETLRFDCMNSGPYYSVWMVIQASGISMETVRAQYEHTNKTVNRFTVRILSTGLFKRYSIVVLTHISALLDMHGQYFVCTLRARHIANANTV